jgi:hypothetical protein
LEKNLGIHEFVLAKHVILAKLANWEKEKKRKETKH